MKRLFGLSLLVCLSFLIAGCVHTDATTTVTTTVTTTTPETTTTTTVTSVTIPTPSFFDPDFIANSLLQTHLEQSDGYVALIYTDSLRTILINENSLYVFFADGTTTRIDDIVFEFQRFEHFDPATNLLYYRDQLNRLKTLNLNDETVATVADAPLGTQYFPGGFVTTSEPIKVRSYASGETTNYADFTFGDIEYWDGDAYYALYQNLANGTVVYFFKNAEVLTNVMIAQTSISGVAAILRDKVIFRSPVIVPDSENYRIAYRYLKLSSDGSVETIDFPDLGSLYSVTPKPVYFQLDYVPEVGEPYTMYYDYEFDAFDLDGMPVLPNHVHEITDELVIGYSAVGMAFEMAIDVVDRSTGETIHSILGEELNGNIVYRSFGSTFLIHSGVYGMEIDGRLFDIHGTLIADQVLGHAQIDEHTAVIVKEPTAGSFQAYLVDVDTGIVSEWSGINFDLRPRVFVYRGVVMFHVNVAESETNLSNAFELELYDPDGTFYGTFVRRSHHMVLMLEDEDGNIVVERN